MTRPNNKKLRAVFLAALMFLWVFAGTMAFAGGAAAQDASINVENLNGASLYQGQEVEFTSFNPGGVSIADGSTIQVQRVTNTNSSGAPISATTSLTGTVNGGTVEFDTSSLQTGEDYVLRYDDGNTGYIDTTGAASDGTLTSDFTAATFTVGEQTLSTSFDDGDGNSEERAGNSIEFSLTSNERANFGLNITEANGDLDNEQLTQLFFNGTQNISGDKGYGGPFTLEDDNLEGDDDAIQVYTSNNDFDGDITIPADDNSIDAGEYTLEFEVNDTSAASTADLTVLEEVDGGVDFDEGTFTETRGDIVEISGTVQGNINEFNLTVGTIDDTGYQANVTVEPNDDDEFTVLMNTRNAGQSSNDVEDGVTDIDNMNDVVFGAAEDQGDVTAAEEHPDASDLASTLTASTYDLQAHSPGTHPSSFGGYDISSMDLLERSTTSMNIWRADGSIAPGDDEIEDLESIQAAVEDGTLTQTDTVSIGDQTEGRAGTADLLVHEISVSGVYGEGTSAENLLNNTGNLTLEYEQLDAGANRDALTLNHTETEFGNFDVVVDRENDRIFAVVNTQDLRFDRDSGTISNNRLPVDETFEVRYNVSARYLADFDRNANVGDDDYTLGEDDEIVSQELDAVDREVDFEVNDNDEIVVPPTADAEISGSTTIAPGTEIDIRSQGTGDAAFLRTAEDVTVSEDGSISGTYDFSEIDDGTEFETTIRQQGFADNGVTDGVVQEGAGEPEPTPTPEPEPEPTDTPEPEPTDTPEPEPDTPMDTDTPEPEPDTPEPTETPEDQPGFGVVVSLIALLGAALLVARRNAQN